MNLLKLLEGWKEEEEEAPEDYLWMAARTYSLLARFSPPGTLRENAMGTYLTFLETHYPSAPNRNLWFGLVRQMLQAARGYSPRKSERDSGMAGTVEKSDHCALCRNRFEAWAVIIPARRIARRSVA